MNTEKNYAAIAGYLEGTMKGQLSSIESMRSYGIMTDKELLDQMVERMKLALDTIAKGI